MTALLPPWPQLFAFSVAVFSDLGYALAAGWFGERMRAGTVDLRWTKWVSGMVFVGLGVWALWVGLAPQR